MKRHAILEFSVRDKGRKVSTTRGADAVTSVNHGGNRARESSTYQQLAAKIDDAGQRCCVG